MLVDREVIAFWRIFRLLDVSGLRIPSLIFALLVPCLQAEEEWAEVIAIHCFDCHDSASAKGEVDLEEALTHPLGARSELWERALRQLQGGMMPPKGKSRPEGGEAKLLLGHLEKTLDDHATDHPNPGRTETLRRLTRTEYEFVIRDLLGVKVDASLLLPPDQSSHGFDNVTVGDLSPALLERYITAAQKISRLALSVSGSSPDGRTVRVPPDLTQEGHVEGLPFGTRGGVVFEHSFLRDGEYEVRIHLMRDRNEHVEGLRGKHELQILLDDEVAATFEVKPPKNRRDHTKVDNHLVKRITIRGGVRRVGATFVKPPSDLIETLRQPYESAFNTHRHPRRSPAIYQVSIAGPFGTERERSAESKILQGLPSRDEAGARSLLTKLVRRAFRGHEEPKDLERAMAFYRAGEEEGGFLGGMDAALASLLVHPKFLFRVERDPAEGKRGEPYELSGLELATRLSFFLWSSIPDEELMRAAEAGELGTPKGRARQVRRMLVDPKSHSLVSNFASQWLYLRNLDAITPDGRLYPDFDGNLRNAMRTETEMLFGAVMKEDRSVLDLLQSDFTFLNQRLAKHYGIPHVYGERFRRVSLPKDSRRGGILRHASILTVTSYATRTSPVLRGHWVLENLLGTPPPPPPPDVPSLDDNRIDASLPVRARLAEHRENKACAACHDAMDPVGFAFEHYDAIGQWRIREGEAGIDAKGALPTGASFDGLAGLENGLLGRPELFVRTLCEKLLTYGLGRGVESSDAPAIRKVVRGGAETDYRFSEIILRLVDSELFTMRRSEL